MLTDYEKITEDLNQFEIDKVLPVVVLNFKRKMKKGNTGKEHAVTSDVICKGVSDKFEGYTLTAVRLRKVIGVIRQMDYIPALCSCSKGYYVAKKMSELDNCIESLEQRISQQQRIVDALKQQKQVIQYNLKV